MNVHVDIAFSHLLTRKRQTVASLLGVLLGVAFFLAVSSLMRGSEADFIRRLVDSAAHITVTDDYRNPRVQPASVRWPGGAVEIRGVKPLPERRGIRQYARKLAQIEALPGVRAAPVLVSPAIFSFAGRDDQVTLSGIEPARMQDVSTIEEDLIQGTLDAVDIDPNGIIIGVGLAERLALGMGDTVSVVSPAGNVRVMRIVGLFRTGNVNFDETQTFAQQKRVQALVNRPNVANSIVIQVEDPYAARQIASRVEAMTGYKAVSWQEANEDILSTLVVRNIIMYTVVGAILVVASFGIYNVISSIVMEKTRDIAILKSIGFNAGDIGRIFLIEGAFSGVAGSLFGSLAGSALIYGVSRVTVRFPGESEPLALPVYWGFDQYLLAFAFAMASAMLASYLPARKGGRLQPVDVLRGAA